MKLGFVSDSLGAMPFEELLDTAAQLGVSGVEVNTGGWSTAPHFDLTAVDTQSRLTERPATVPIGAELVRRSTALPAAVLLGWIRGTHYTGGQPAKAQAIGTGGLHRRVIDRHANPLIDRALWGPDGLVTAYGGSAASTRQINDPAM